MSNQRFDLNGTIVSHFNNGIILKQRNEIMSVLTRRQREIFNFLRDNTESFSRPPSLDELETLQKKSR